MAYQYGKALLVKVDIANVKTSLLGQQGGGFELTGEPIEAYAKADFPVTKRVVGWTDWKMDADCLVDLSDGALDALELAAAPATQASVIVQCVIGADTFTGTAQVVSIKKSGAKGEMATAAVSFTALSALVKA